MTLFSAMIGLRIGYGGGLVVFLLVELIIILLLIYYFIFGESILNTRIETKKSIIFIKKNEVYL
jgi:hypothetical protein